MNQSLQITVAWIITLSSLIASAQQLHVNPRSGNDANTGSPSRPLKTIREAANRINAITAKEPATIILSEGLHVLTETVLFKNDHLSVENRLRIRAEVLPDDPKWNPQRMPMITTIVAGTPSPGDGE